MDKVNISKRLVEIFGQERVASDEATLYIYSQDMTESEPSKPDFVVMPRTPEEVSKLLILANEEKVPVTPFVTGSNVGGLAIPVKGGIVADLKGMKSILEVNETDMYALIEPGVTFGHLRAELDRNHPGLIYAYPLAPPYVSVLCNALLDGLNNMCLKHGAMSEWINAAEVVLPTGEIVRVGSSSVTPSWCSRVPMPDLAGLFISWQGSTGIVTKLATQLCPKPKFRQRQFLMTYELERSFDFMRSAAHLEIFDDIGGFSGHTAKTMFVKQGHISLSEGDPEFLIYLDFSGNSEHEMKDKERTFKELVADYAKRGYKADGPILVDALVKLSPKYAKFAEFPTTLDFLLDHGQGGLTWVGSYGPVSMWEKGARACHDLHKKHGYFPVLVTRPMRGGHFGVLRYIIAFDRKDPAERKRVREFLVELATTLLDNHFIPYKSPIWAAEMIMKRADPGMFELMKRLKKMLDPNGIMNPGRWTL
jgi:FAD/FMN-containing dehydrogenase